MKSRRMKSPHVSEVYNGTMWTVDIDDFQALNDGTSWERGCRSRKWWYIAQEIPATSVRFRTFSDISGQKIQRGAKALKIVRKQLG